MKYLSALILIFTSITLQAGPIMDELKNTPATKFDIALNKFLGQTVQLTDELRGEYVESKSEPYRFKYNGFLALPNPKSGSITLITVLESTARYTTAEKCQNIKGDTVPRKSSSLIKLLFPDLAPEQRAGLLNEIEDITLLFAKENKALQVRC